MIEEPKGSSAEEEGLLPSEGPDEELPAEEPSRIRSFRPFHSRLVSLGNKLTRFYETISDAFGWLAAGKVRISIATGVFAGLIVSLGFALFELRKDEWILRHEYPNALSSHERYCSYARDLILKKDHKRAEQILRNLVKKEDDARTHADALILLGKCLDLSERSPDGMKEARGIYERFIHEYPADPRVPVVQRLIAETLTGNQLYHDSNAQYGKLLRMLPDSEQSGEIEFLIARNHYRAGDLAKAIDVLEHVRQKYAGATVARDSALQLALTLDEFGRPGDAERVLSSLADEEPGSPHAAVALHMLAKHALDAGSYESAIKYCTRWFKESSQMRDQVDVMLTLGSAKLAVGAPASSTNAASDIVTFFPDSPKLAEAIVLRGRSYEALGNIGGAEQSYFEAVRVAPDEALPRKQLARWYHSRGNLAGAIEQMKHACEAAPRDDALVIELAKLYRLNAENVNALAVLAEFTRERQLSPRIGEAFLMISDIQRELDRPQDAYKTLDRLLATGTATVEASVVLEKQADILAEVGLHDDAVAAYRLASEAGAESAAVACKIANAFLAAGNARECLAELDSIELAACSRGDSFDMLELKARAYLDLGMYAEARRSIKNAIALRTGQEKFSTLALLLRSSVALQDEAAASKVSEVTLKLIENEDAELPLEARRIVLDWAHHLYDNGEYSEGARVYSRVVSPCFPADDVAWAVYQMGNCYYHMADYDRAKEAYDRLTREFSGSVWARFARQRKERIRFGSET